MGKLMYSLAVAGLVCICLGCDKGPNSKIILGAWKVDSTYTFYNGFDLTEREDGGDWATYVYGEDGVMKEIKYNSYQSYFFEFPVKDTLKISSTSGSNDIFFQVLRLDEDKMVLKKSKTPAFKGKNQVRYEIRYFSRTKMPEVEATPFSDPRQ